MNAATLQNRNRRVGLIALAMGLAMLGLGYAAVPLYRMFCQVTGFGGTTQRATAAEAARIKVSGRTIIVRFDGNVDRNMPWRFGPAQVSQTVAIGARSLARFTAKNLSDKPITGRASFNVEPEQAGIYFHKIQCFCFTEQTLQPGQEADMPVVYYVDPKILDDPDAKDIGAITLSYTFHKTEDAGAKALDRAGTGG
ncbi:MAG: cytochrome c oxidase assembly protein [Novosphingobium sp.]|jgi:cytochrome c oxidase assembly protein subunit 11|nr:cytochrome c oxidase assembly protein [Novosphingobium sp.]